MEVKKKTTPNQGSRCRAGTTYRYQEQKQFRKDAAESMMQRMVSGERDGVIVTDAMKKI
jgi:hypothetical protein